MFRLIAHYAFRSLRRNGFYHFINLFGLVIAFTSVFYILIWINQELGYDDYHPAAERIYRFSLEFRRGDHTSHFARTWQAWTVDMPDYFPEIEAMNRLQTMRKARFRIGENKFTDRNFFRVDSTYFQFFGNRLLRGNPETILREPGTIVLSERMARRCFGVEDPMGKEILAAHQFDTAYHSFTVTGIMEEPRPDSHFKIDMLAPIDYSLEDPGWAYIYLRLREGTEPADIFEKFPVFIGRYMEEDRIGELTPYLQPIGDIHLRSDKDREIEPNNRERSLYIFAGVGLVLLLIVFMNNANLQIAMFNRRLRFIFLNRVNGARIRDVAGFFAWESFMVYGISAITALIIILLTGPWIERYFGYHLEAAGAGVWLQLLFLAIILSALGTLSGLLPLFMLAGRERLHYQTGRVFYRTGFDAFREAGGITGRKALMVAQFTGSLVLVLLTLFMTFQIRFMLRAGIGGGQDDIIVLSNLPQPALEKYPVFKRELMASSMILDVSASMEEPSKLLMDAMRFEMEGMDESMRDELIGVFPVDDNFLDFYGIKLLAGRNFPPYGGMDAPEYYILNESALRRLGLKEPEDAIGRSFMLIFNWPEIFNGGTIIGVSEDFHFYTLKQPIKPMVMFQKHIWFWNFLVRVDEDRFAEALDFIRREWDDVYPELPLEYKLVDELYTGIYGHEIVQAKILGVLSILTVIIACLGLVGLMHYVAGTRTREIGIRKVNGATTPNIIYLLNRELFFMILMAVLAGIPIAWYLVSSWLRNYAYRIDIDGWIMGLTGLGFMVLSMLTVSYQSWMAARRNPAKSLRYE